MKIKSFLIIFTIILLYSSTSLAAIIDSSPNIGRDLLLPEDIPRAAIISFNHTYFLQNSRNTLNETLIFEITLGKYYLNSITSLSTNDLFGSLSYYNKYVSLFNEINNSSKMVLKDLVKVINTLGKFTNTDTTKFYPFVTSIPNLVNNFVQLISNSSTLKNSIEISTANLSTNVPNSETFTVVYNNYKFVSKSLNCTIEILNRVKDYLNNVKLNLDRAKVISNEYNFSNDEDTYLRGMNIEMINLLTISNLLYNDLFLFSILTDSF
ncbi:hypothetical protein ACTFIU_007577 [Dictyostelium citrinum]